ncbi:hypothetical protein Vafri_21296, partial [Volvox africanus]
SHMAALHAVASGDDAAAAAATTSSPAGSRKVRGRRAREEVEAVVQEAVRGVVGSSVSPDAPLMSSGLDSLGAVELRNALEGRLGVQLPSTLVFDYPTPAAVSEFIAAQLGAGSET